MAQGYKEVKVLTATCKFKRKAADEYYLAWTTTPWTLPSNVALCMNPDYDYVKIESKGAKFILAKERVHVFFNEGEYSVIEEKKGADYEGAYLRAALRVL